MMQCKEPGWRSLGHFQADETGIPAIFHWSMNKFPAVSSEALQHPKITFISTPISPKLFKKYRYTNGTTVRLLDQEHGSKTLICRDLDMITVRLLHKHNLHWCDLEILEYQLRNFMLLPGSQVH